MRLKRLMKDHYKKEIESIHLPGDLNYKPETGSKNKFRLSDMLLYSSSTAAAIVVIVLCFTTKGPFEEHMASIHMKYNVERHVDRAVNNLSSNLDQSNIFRKER